MSESKNVSLRGPDEDGAMTPPLPEEEMEEVPKKPVPRFETETRWQVQSEFLYNMAFTNDLPEYPIGPFFYPLKKPSNQKLAQYFPSSLEASILWTHESRSGEKKPESVGSGVICNFVDPISYSEPILEKIKTQMLKDKMKREGEVGEDGEVDFVSFKKQRRNRRVMSAISSHPDDVSVEQLVRELKKTNYRSLGRWKGIQSHHHNHNHNLDAQKTEEGGGGGGGGDGKGSESSRLDSSYLNPTWLKSSRAGPSVKLREEDLSQSEMFHEFDIGTFYKDKPQKWVKKDDGRKKKSQKNNDDDISWEEEKEVNQQLRENDKIEIANEFEKSVSNLALGRYTMNETDFSVSKVSLHVPITGQDFIQTIFDGDESRTWRRRSGRAKTNQHVGSVLVETLDGDEGGSSGKKKKRKRERGGGKDDGIDFDLMQIKEQDETELMNTTTDQQFQELDFVRPYCLSWKDHKMKQSFLIPYDTNTDYDDHEVEEVVRERGVLRMDRLGEIRRRKKMKANTNTLSTSSSMKEKLQKQKDLMLGGPSLDQNKVEGEEEDDEDRAPLQQHHPTNSQEDEEESPPLSQSHQPTSSFKRETKRIRRDGRYTSEEYNDALEEWKESVKECQP